MRLKSYFVHTMEEALQAAKIELGDDAMLVDSKRLDSSETGRARLEVVFAAVNPPPPPPVLKPSPSVPRRSAIREIQELRNELTTLVDALSGSPDRSRLGSSSRAWKELDQLRGRLLCSEVPSLAVDEMISRCGPVLDGLVGRVASPAREIQDAMVAMLAAEWRHVQGRQRGGAQSIAFVGPTGAGKTSAIAKLAFRLGVVDARPIHVISIDNLRIGASDQLAHICSLLGIPFQAIGFSGALHQAIAGYAQRAIVLIDTPGYGPADSDIIEETAAHLRRADSIQCQMVLPATMRFSEMQRRQQHFLSFAPSRLLFTRFDETELFGPAWAFARASRLPVDWVSTGPAIPEDIEEADATRVASALLGRSTYSSGPNSEEPASNLASAASAGASRI